MIAVFQRRPLAFSLAVTAAVLAAIIVIELGVGGGLREALAPSSAKRAVAAEAKLLPPVVATAPEQAYPETTARPLFLPTRRPAPVATAEDRKAFVQGQFVLQGVTVAGDTRIALLREKANGRLHRVERGREVNGIQVIEIQPEGVTLAQGGEREVLSLQVQRPTGAPVAASQAGPFAPTLPPPGTPQAAVAGQAAPAASAALVAPQSQAAPAVRADAIPLQPGVPPTTSGANPMAREQAAPMTPEELLARRRARRTQPTQ